MRPFSLLCFAGVLSVSTCFFLGISNVSKVTSSSSGRGAAGASTSFTARQSSPRTILAMTSLEFAKDQIATNDVVVFSKSYCPYCNSTKKLFKDMGVAAAIIELDNRSDGGDIQDALEDFTKQRSVPNVFVKGTHVGGNDATQSAAKSGALKELLDGERKA